MFATLLLFCLCAAVTTDEPSQIDKGTTVHARRPALPYDDPPCRVITAPSARSFGSSACPTSITKLRGYSADDGLTVDIMAVYTAAARDAAGGVSQIEAKIDQAAAITNQAMANSLIPTRVRIIRKALIDYTESGDAIMDLNRLVHTSDLQLDSVHADRDTYGADLVSLWVASLNSGGAAYQLSALDGDDDGRAGFNVVRQDTAAGDTLAHELGHNFGCQHDRDNLQGVGFYPYSYGYREPGGLWRDLMAYPPGTGLLYYSNPNIIYSGPPGNPGPLGVPGEDANSSCDNARAIINTSFTLANFRPAALSVTPSARLYVNANTSTNGDGSTWGNAIQDMQIAIGKAVASRGVVKEVWVAAGTYKPDRGRNDRLMSFRLVEGVSIYGGFAGGETLLSQRDVAANPCVLSGDIGTGIDASDNSFHVLSVTDLDASAVLDGFTITAGNADGPWPHDSGGGLFGFCGSPTIRHCRFNGNNALTGGGAAQIAGGGGPRFVDSVFEFNNAYYGGGVHADIGTTPRFEQCEFNYNTAISAGGMRSVNSSPTLIACTFLGNGADYSGGMECIAGGSPMLSDCTFTDNFADYGGGLGIYEGAVSLTNCRFEYNTAISGGGLIAGNFGIPTLIQCVFFGNEASYGGGAHCWGDSNGYFELCTFESNAGDGAGMYNNSSSPTLESCTFMGNVSTGVAGAMANVEHSHPELYDCTFEYNFADCCGGAVANFSGSQPLLKHVLFIANEANYGGAVWCADPDSDAVHVNCRFIGNVALYGGGAILTTQSAVSSYIGCVFSGNSTPFGYGGVADNRDSSPSFVNCTLAGNSAGYYTGGISNYAAYSTVANCILWNNSDFDGTISSSQLTAVNGGSFGVHYSIVQGGFTGTGNLSGDPLFADEDGVDNAVGTLDDNLHVTAGSPAIDSADTAALLPILLQDVDHASRFIDDSPTSNTGAGSPNYLDRGAYEFIRAVTGDVDCDGALTAADVPVFVAALLDGSSYTNCDLLRGDFNADNFVDGRDIHPFVQALLP